MFNVANYRSQTIPFTMNPARVIQKALDILRAYGYTLKVPVDRLELHGRAAIFSVGQKVFSAVTYRSECDVVIDFADYDVIAFDDVVNYIENHGEFLDAAFTTYNTGMRDTETILSEYGASSDPLPYCAKAFLAKECHAYKEQNPDDCYF